MIGLFAFQACETTTPAASSTTPFVVSFEFNEPVQASDAEKERFIAALAKYPIAKASKIKVAGKQIWPLPKGTLTTERVVATERRDGSAGSVWVGPVTGTQFPKAFVASPRSTQYLAFRTESDMRAFLRATAGK
ncbi:MAG: hypothetical protein ABR589_01295 [Chthoniobacterales bacterium]